MTKEMKLQYHLEMVIYESHQGWSFSAKQIEFLASQATPEEKEQAYQRALTRSPLLLDDERRPE